MGNGLKEESGGDDQSDRTVLVQRYSGVHQHVPEEDDNPDENLVPEGGGERLR